MDSLTNRQWTTFSSLLSQLDPMTESNRHLHYTVALLSANLEVSDDDRADAIDSILETFERAAATLQDVVMLERAGMTGHCSHDRTKPPELSAVIGQEGYHPRWFYLTACDHASTAVQTADRTRFQTARNEAWSFFQGHTKVLSSETRILIMSTIVRHVRTLSSGARSQECTVEQFVYA